MGSMMTFAEESKSMPLSLPSPFLTYKPGAQSREVCVVWEFRVYNYIISATDR